MHVCVKSRFRRHGKGARSRPPCCGRPSKPPPPPPSVSVSRVARLPRLRGLAGAEGVLVRAHRRWQPRGPGPSRLGCARRPALSAELPAARGILGGRLGRRRQRETFFRILSVLGAVAVALPCRQPPSCNRPHLCGRPHLTATHASARPAHPCAPRYGAPDEPEVVAPLAEASLVVVLIELALVEFSCVGAAGQWWAGASIGAGAM